MNEIIKKTEGNMEKYSKHIYLPVSLNELGQRANNEDSIYPEIATLNDRLFIVCDGVGGHSKGEVASALVCENFAQFIKQNNQDAISKNFFESGLRYVETKMEDYVNNDSGCSKMATTLTLLYFSEDYKLAYLIWVGDSRIYHIRDGKVLFQTKDHSEVQSLIDMGEITEQEALNHPRRNVITRAISGSSNPTRIDYKQIDEIHSNDFFLLCTDGILENLNEDKIEKCFNVESDPQEIKEKIIAHSYKNTRDNYSMYLIKTK
ncbi:protein phosphatase 2C domain-containing protein [Flavivirga amylovorans]|uniref:Protein phosphatase 2C domain-containing protein n=1 Tax=Flavivirga amylovorans TaxID=870486 RepID=A0ABT8WX35_9FLAO|nr:protein phosphatase 2C domain-containing protein [Flavivirga amylovorans]MDO5986241.1 protein phosphatase 2C domain-containing protein [Flavivirga amylovorans]